jgi:hypothetical protein
MGTTLRLPDSNQKDTHVGRLFRNDWDSSRVTRYFMMYPLQRGSCLRDLVIQLLSVTSTTTDGRYLRIDDFISNNILTSIIMMAHLSIV